MVSKYHARRTWSVHLGRWFDSDQQRVHGEGLALAEKGGQISDLEFEPSFELQPAFRLNGQAIRAIVYRADFRYTENGRRVVEEWKGAETAVWLLKRKLFLFRYRDLELRVIKP